MKHFFCGIAMLLGTGSVMATDCSSVRVEVSALNGNTWQAVAYDENGNACGEGISGNRNAARQLALDDCGC